MATAFFSASASSNLYLHHRFNQNHSHLPPLTSPSIPPPSSRLRPQTLFLNAAPHRVRRIAFAPLRPPTPPSPDPPPPRSTKSLVEVASMFQDRVKIFLALLIWVSLFFWASALQGKDRGNGKGKKGSRFK